MQRIEKIEAGQQQIQDMLGRLLSDRGGSSVGGGGSSRCSGGGFTQQSPDRSDDSWELASSPLVQSKVDSFLEKLKAAQQVTSDDSGGSARATAGGTVAASVSSGGGSRKGGPNWKNDVGLYAESLEKEAANPREQALAHLRKYENMPDMKIGGGATVRVAPPLIAKLYRNGTSAQRELSTFVQSRGLQRCHAAQEMPTLGLILDRLFATENIDSINLSAVEVLARKIYGLIRCFEEVHEESDWKMPKNAPRGWRSKAKWGLLEEYDVEKLESSEWTIPEADEEVSSRLQRKALFNRHLSASDGPKTADE